MKYQGIQYRPPRRGQEPRPYAIMKVNGKELRAGPFDTEREAAKAYDRMRVKRGMPPVNVLRSAGESRGNDVR